VKKFNFNHDHKDAEICEYHNSTVYTHIGTNTIDFMLRYKPTR